MENIIEVKNLHVKYGGSDAVHDVSFGLERGDYVGLTGPNGAGKTTLIKAIFGLVKPSSGRVILFGKHSEKFREWHRIGYLPQNLSTLNPIFPASVEEVVELGLLSSKKYPKRMDKNDRLKVSRILQELQIAKLRKRTLPELSGGQQQRVMLARALVAEPDVLIFDEPSTALDPESRDSFFRLIGKLNREKKITVILITHDTGNLGQYAGKLLYLDKKLVYFGSFADFCHSKKMGAYFGDLDQHIICHQHE